MTDRNPRDVAKEYRSLTSLVEKVAEKDFSGALDDLKDRKNTIM